MVRAPIKGKFIVLLALTVTLLLLFPNPFYHTSDKEFSVTHIDPALKYGSIESEPSPATRNDNVLVEDFSTMENIDFSNTTVVVDTYNKDVHLRGQGTPKSNIRQVTQHDHFVAHNGFNSMAVDENGRYYHLNAGGGTTVEIFNDWTDYFNSQPRIDTINIPESQHSTQMFIANGHLYTSSEASDTLRKVRLGDKATVQSNIKHARTSSWGWRGPRQQGVACDGVYIYTWSDTTLKVWDLNENLLRTVNGLPNKNSYSTCFAVGHYFYTVAYSQARITHRVDGDTGSIHSYTNEVFISNSYVVDASYDYFHNRLFTGLGWSNTYALDNVADVWGNLEGFTNGTIQSKPIYQKWPMVGAAKMTWFEYKPQGTDIVYNMTADGEKWVTGQNASWHVFDNRGSRLMWNATLTTKDPDVTPGIDSIIIQYDLVSDPEPFAPVSSIWQGNNTPKLEWNFTDPDAGDGQSDYHLEIFDKPEMEKLVYNSSWVNSTKPEHTVGMELEDGTYYWRVRTKDCFHAASNFSVFKKIMIDVTKPVGNITIEEGAVTVNENLVDLVINATDNGSGIADMQIIGDRGNVGPWEEYGTEKRIALTQTDGLKKIGVRFRDHAGIVSDVFNDSIYFDLKGPGDLVISSPTHPDELIYYNSTLPVFQWQSPIEVAGIKGYSYMLDGSPITEPTKVIYTTNSHLTGTFPGEFSGLADGTWYFHISSCDIYDQWSNMTHFRINIDTSVPIISDLGPDSTVWYNGTSVDAYVIFEDPDSFGLNLDSMMYSYRKDGDNSFSPWTMENLEFEVVDKGISENPIKVRADVKIELSEGFDNIIRWRISDLAGNGPSISNDLKVKIDMSPVVFSKPTPDEEEIFLDSMIVCGITITDTGGSGVDGKTVEYCISNWGDNEGNYVNWTSVGNNMVLENMDVVLDIRFERGRDNYIKWRATDAVGNGFSVSDGYRIRINSPPIPVIDTPRPDAVFEEGSTISINGTGTIDIDRDELSYHWQIKNRTTKKIVYRGNGVTTTAVLYLPGEYIILLFVDDGYGFNESTSIEIEILPKPSKEEVQERWEDTTDSDGDSLPDWWEKINGLDPEDPNDATDESLESYYQGLDKQNKQKETSKGFLANYWWVLICIAALVLLMIIIVLLMTARRKKKDKEAQAAIGKMGRVPQGDQIGTYPQGMAGPNGQFNSFGQPGTQNSMAHPNQLSPLPSGPGIVSPYVGYQQQTGYGCQALTYQSLTPPTQLAPVALPAQTQNAPAQPDGTTYGLPAFTTDQGTLDLNRLALPELGSTIDTTIPGTPEMPGADLPPAMEPLLPSAAASGSIANGTQPDDNFQNLMMSIQALEMPIVEGIVNTVPEPVINSTGQNSEVSPVTPPLPPSPPLQTPTSPETPPENNIEPPTAPPVPPPQALPPVP
ncbi:MAG: hypothetical protein QF682_04510 [Candidatus Thermoplasmatota archaeon]|jgi:hypothetical protein|nr:hypothetical protein [Candidatus Thermoplasmatota archaeon]